MRLPVAWAFRFLVAIIIIIAIFLIFYLTSGKPTTTDAYVQAQVLPVSSGVAGKVLLLKVKNHQQVHKGQLLLEVDPKPYQIVLLQAENYLKQAKRQLVILRRGVIIAQSKLQQQELKLSLSKDKYQRFRTLYKEGAYSKEGFNILQNEYQILSADVQMAKLELDIAEQRTSADSLAALDSQKAKQAIALAEYNLSRVKIYASYNGSIANLTLSTGDQVLAGQVLFAIVVANSFWIQANFKDTQIGEISVGDKALITLSASSGVQFTGIVRSISPGISRNQENSVSGLLQTKPENNWVNLPQRIPVIIQLTKIPANINLIVGSSATVAIKSK